MILPRYLLREILAPLIAWVGFLFLLLFVMSFLRGTDVLLGSAVTARDLGLFTVYLAPHFLQQALPIAFLLAILLGIGRLSEDGELSAMKAVGVGPAQILAGPLLLAAGIGALVMGMAYSLEPWGLRAVKHAANEVIKRNLVGDVKPGIFYDDLSDLTLYAERVSGAERRWHNVLVHDGRDPASPLLVMARSAQVNPTGAGEALKLALSEGGVHRADRASDEYAVVEFERGELVVGVGETFYYKNRFRRPNEELSPGELLKAAAQARSRGEDSRTLLMAYHARWGQALMPLSFALVGVPLAMSRGRSGRARGYLLTIGAYVLYYVTARACAGLGERGLLPALLGGQLPNLVFAGLGALALSRVAREGSLR
ncbi:MAG: LptF/LptG family permease [Myxococcales bacterium]|nr:LptF/LptG family permease [Myxococcales bacterium]